MESTMKDVMGDGIEGMRCFCVVNWEGLVQFG